MKKTDMMTITAAKAKVTPMISAARPFSIAFCCASTSLAVEVELVSFSSSILGTEVVDLRSLSSGLEPSCREEIKLNDNCSHYIGAELIHGVIIELGRGLTSAGEADDEHIKSSRVSPLYSFSLCMDSDEQWLACY